MLSLRLNVSARLDFLFDYTRVLEIDNPPSPCSSVVKLPYAHNSLLS